MPLRRTHVWGEAPFSWGSSVLAAQISDDGSVASSIHADGAWVEWDVATGLRRRVISRGRTLVAATFLAHGESALVMVAPHLQATREIETIDRASGDRRMHTRTSSGVSSLMLAPDETAFACAPRGLGPVHSLHPIEGGEPFVTSHSRHRWLAIGPDRARIALVEIPHPDGWRILGYGGDGSPIEEEAGPPTYELQLLGSAGETLEVWPVGGPSGAPSAVFAPDGRHVIAIHDGALFAWDRIDGRERWRVPLDAKYGRLWTQHGRLYFAGYETTFFVRAIALEDGSTRWTSPIAGSSITSDETLMVASEGSSLALYDVKRGVRRETRPAHPPVRMLAFSSDARQVAAKIAYATVGIGSVSERDGDATWSVTAGVSTRDVLTFDPRGRLWTGEGQIWVLGEHGALLREPDSDPQWQPRCWSASGARVLVEYGRPGTSSLAVYDAAGAYVSGIGQGGPRHSLGLFEGEELVLFALCQIWRTRFEDRPVFVHPPRLVERWLAHDNVIGALAPGRLLVIDRKTQPRVVRPDRTPETRRLRLVDHTESEPTVRVLKEWSHREAIGEPLIALSADGTRALDAVVGEAQVRVWSIEACAEIGGVDLTDEGDAAASLAISRDGNVIAIGTTRGRVLRYEWSET